MANPFIGGTRAAVGQGLGMGWGDEAEAWLRSKLGNESYEDNLKKVRNEYAEFSQQYPVTSGTSEFLGGAAPGVAMMMYPPTRQAGAQRVQSAAAATASRVPAWAKLAGAGGCLLYTSDAADE
jgi:hypothetical protein